jgi:hypothetical protein
MVDYIVLLKFDEETVVLKVPARDAKDARKQAFQFSVDQGWGMPKALKPRILHQGKIEHLATIGPKIVEVEIERKYNYTPHLEYA